MVEPATRVRVLASTTRIFLDLFHDLTDAILLVVGDMPLDTEAPVVTLSISRICRISLLEVLIGVGLHTCVHRGKCAYVYISASVRCDSKKSPVLMIGGLLSHIHRCVPWADVGFYWYL